MVFGVDVVESFEGGGDVVQHGAVDLASGVVPI